MAVPFTCSDGNFVFVLSGKVFYMNKDNPIYSSVLEQLKDICEDELRDLLEADPNIKPKQTPVGSVVEDGGVTVSADGTLRLNGEEVHGTIATRIREFSAMGLSYENLVLFLENVSQNPSFGAQQELFEFLENRGMPITEDGCFLAYKAVRSDYMDKFSGRIDNSPGQTVEMIRHKVDDNRAKHCSAGLHCGALDYISWYGGGDDKIVVVKVNPKDVVSVPNDCACMKCRVCKYVVLRDFEGEYNEPLVNTAGDYEDDSDGAECSDSLVWADNNHRDDDEDDSFDEGDVCSCCWAEEDDEDCDDDGDDEDDSYADSQYGSYYDGFGGRANR